MILEAFEKTLQRLVDACKKVYGGDLITLTAFGSVARGTPNPNSDIDITYYKKFTFRQNEKDAAI